MRVHCPHFMVRTLPHVANLVSLLVFNFSSHVASYYCVFNIAFNCIIYSVSSAKMQWMWEEIFVDCSKIS